MSLKMKKQKGEFKKPVVLNIEQKIAVLEDLQKGASMTSLAHKYNVDKCTISRINKSNEKIFEEKKLLESCEGNLEKKKFTGIEDTLLEKSIYKWFVQCRSAGVPITGVAIQEKAVEFNTKLGGSEKFVASAGWLHKFKQCHGIRSISIQGEKLSADVPASEEFKDNIKKFMQVSGATVDEIYNCDETGLQWKMLPDRTLASRTEASASGRKKSKINISIMVCTNASGSHKLPLFIIGKSKKPRCFGNISLPVIYRNSKKAWMNRGLMLDWYQNVFIKEVEEKHDLKSNPHKRIILLMDNAPCHPAAETFNSINESCTVHFLPPNVTSLIQPMDQGVIEKFKRGYKKLFVKTLHEEKTLEGVDNAIKEFNLLNCYYFASISWNNISSKDIRNCWKRLIPLETESSDIECISVADFHSLMMKVAGYNSVPVENIVDWLNIENENIGWEMISDQQIIASVHSKDIEDALTPGTVSADSSCSDDEPSDVQTKVSSLAALRAANTLIDFCQSGVIEKTDNYVITLAQLCNDISSNMLLHE